MKRTTLTDICMLTLVFFASTDKINRQREIFKILQSDVLSWVWAHLNCAAWMLQHDNIFSQSFKSIGCWFWTILHAFLRQHECPWTNPTFNDPVILPSQSLRTGPVERPITHTDLFRSNLWHDWDLSLKFSCMSSIQPLEADRVFYFEILMMLLKYTSYSLLIWSMVGQSKKKIATRQFANEIFGKKTEAINMGHPVVA